MLRDLYKIKLNLLNGTLGTISRLLELSVVTEQQKYKLSTPFLRRIFYL